MKKNNIITRLHGLILLVFLIAFGCASPVLNMPKSRPDIIKEYKNINVRADVPYLKKTGIYIEKGEIFSILAKGDIRMFSGSKIGHGPGRKLAMMIGNKIVTHNGYDTIKSEFSGVIKLGVVDGAYDYKRGKAENPNWYKNNLGQFHVDLIIWKTNNYSQIAEFFADMKKEDPDNIVIHAAFGYLNQYEKIELARKETSNEIEKTRKQLNDLIDKSKAQNKPSNDPILQSKKIIEVESKLTQLMKTLEQLDEMKKKFAEERTKSKLLAKELEEHQKKEQELLIKLEKSSKTPPIIVITSPEDEINTETPFIALSGVAIDDLGLKQLRIFVNDKFFEDQARRGLKIQEKEYQKRFSFKSRIPLDKGKNQIKLHAVDSDDLLTERIVTVNKIETRRKIWAVVIGINNYPQIRQLNYAVNDAKAFYQYLLNFNKIPPENVVLLLNQEAKLTRIRSTLGTYLKKKAGKEDMVIIYFAGHGATEKEVTSPDRDGLEKYLLPYDVNPKDLYATALPMGEISRIFARIQSERLIFIADSCYSGASGGRTIGLAGIRSNISDSFLDRIAMGKGKIILTASGVNEVSEENNNLRHGVFTYYLLEGLRGHADTDRDGLITVDEIYRYVSERVPEATNNTQHPVKKGSVEGQLVLGFVE